MDRKVLYLDTETTGIDPVRNDILRAAFIIEINGKVEEEAVFSVQPISYAHIDLMALQVNGLTMEMIKEFDEPHVVLFDMLKLFSKYIDKYDSSDKFIPVGYNTVFDLNFLSKFFKNADPNDDESCKYGLGSWVSWYAFDLLAHLRNTAFFHGNYFGKNLKLSTVTEKLGIPHFAHDALEDVRVVREIMQRYGSGLSDSLVTFAAAPK